MIRSAAAVLSAAVSVAVLTACTARPEPAKKPAEDPGEPAAYRLVSFPDCNATLAGLRSAARDNLLAWGAAGRQFGVDNGGGRADAQAATGGAPAADPGNSGQEADKASGHSGTNTHEAGVDEPDLVKTDGKRIITVQDGVLRVVDAASRAQVTRLDLRTPDEAGVVADQYRMSEMLIAGDKVLLLGSMDQPHYPGRGEGRVAPQLTLVDLGGTPRVAGRFAMDGSLVDARQVGSTVRVVMRSYPDIDRPNNAGTVDAYKAAMLSAINNADLDDWLPKFSVDDGSTVSSGRVDCSAVAHPAQFSATSMLTVLTFDLTRGTLGNGDPVTIAADGDTVYSNGPSLYVANDQRWRVEMAVDDGPQTRVEQRTEIYKFDTSKPGRPPFVGGGAVDGWLLNQYSLSDWNGHLRVATTTGQSRGTGPASESAVYVLRHSGKQLQVVGTVGGLGKGERIYSVRFVGGTGYVVTFRQTDPLYTVDLRNPEKPVVTGELKITGYSAYLHPAGDGRLIGIGQEASEQGRTQGTQISLFDVGDPAKPSRLAQYHIKGGHSEAEFDPHAFLYWPQTGLLVVPLNTYKSSSNEQKSGALALKITDGAITELGFLQHPGEAGSIYSSAIRRSLVINGTLWTVSSRGLMASDLGNVSSQAWLPFN